MIVLQLPLVSARVTVEGAEALARCASEVGHPSGLCKFLLERLLLGVGSGSLPRPTAGLGAEDGRPPGLRLGSSLDPTALEVEFAASSICIPGVDCLASQELLRASSWW